MKATLHFNLPEDKEEFELAQKAMDFQYVIQEFDNYLRSKLKYEDGSLTESAYKALEEARGVLFDFRRDAGVLDD